MKTKTVNQKENVAVNSQGLSSPKGAINFNNAFLIKGNKVMPFSEDHLRSAPVERKFRSVKELEEVVMKNSKSFFGSQSFLITMSKEGETIFGEGYNPNGFLLDLGDFTRPRFYILDITFSRQISLGEIMVRIAKHISTLKNQEVIEKLCALFSKDKQVSKELLAKLKPADIPYYLKTAIIGKASVLLLMDSEINDLPEVLSTFSDGWQSVKQIMLKKYASNGHTLCVLSPPFAEIHNNGKKRTPNTPVTEEYHLEKASEEMNQVYKKVKAELLKADNQLQFNPQKYYVSLRKNRNLAFFHFSRKNISLVMMNPEKDTRKQIKHHEVKSLTEKVQKFWNGPSCTVMIENKKHLQEVISLLKKLIKA